jgi:ABC-type Fe3+/spermidine/putrescine transport system ATPase subunit
MLIEAHAITKSFGATAVLKGVSFGAGKGEIVSLLGPSGCGKSTLLRIVAGLEQDYSGTIIFNEHTIDGVPAHRRGFGLMFQDFALFPHRSVGDNVAFGPRMQGLDRREIDRRVADALELVGLGAYRERTIFELSGGERQRVALARSLAPRPALLLLDEPLGALDRTLRERLTGELRDIIKQTGTTSVYVTHDQTEAFAVADRIILMDAGLIVQSGTPAEVYRQPATAFAARFLGLNNLVEGMAIGDAQTNVVRTVLGDLHVANGRAPLPGQQALLLIRPEAAELPTGATANIVAGTIVRRAFRGGSERIVLRHASGLELELDVEAGSLPNQAEVRVALKPSALTMLPAA